MKLIHGDCLVEMQNIPDKSIDLIVTDPPYKIITGGDSNGANSERPKGILKGNRELMPSIPKFDDWLPECFRILKKWFSRLFYGKFYQPVGNGGMPQKGWLYDSQPFSVGEK